MMKEVVIARYKEKLSWINLLPEDVLINVFNKGGDDFILSNANNFILENVGRESDTYLRYIVNRYDTLPDCVLFLQGSIDDRLDQKIFNLHDFFNVATSWSFVGALRTCFEDEGWGKELDYKHNISNFDLTFGEFQKHFIGIDFHKHSLFVPGAYFLVGRDLIRRHPINFYQNLLLTELGTHQNPRFGHFMERSWFRIFQGF